MFDWLGVGLIGLGLGLVCAGMIKRRHRSLHPVPAGDIRPEFAAMGAIVRPLILFLVGVFAFKMSLFYFAFGGERFLTPLEYGGLMFVLAAYSGYLVMVTTKPREATVQHRAEAKSTA